MSNIVLTVDSFYYQMRYALGKQSWVDFKMATPLDILQITHMYLPQTGSFCLYKDQGYSIRIVNTCISIAGIQNCLTSKMQNSPFSFLLSHLSNTLLRDKSATRQAVRANLERKHCNYSSGHKTVPVPLC